jgi:hypothetical protein
VITFGNTETGIVTVTHTNSAGIYSTPNLAPGNYIVSSEASGLTSGQSRLTLVVGQNQILNVQMRVADVVELVDVSANVATVELGTAAISHVVDGRAARELPLNGCDWTQLAQLEPSAYGFLRNDALEARGSSTKSDCRFTGISSASR